MGSVPCSFFSSLTGFAPAKDKNPMQADCKVFFVAVEHDEQTSNLNMVGLNKEQQDWYRKHGGKEAPGICLVNGTEKGQRVTAETVDENFVAKAVGSAPLYSIAWEEHLVYVPDDSGGHRAYVANGILSIWTASAKGGEGDFVALAPIHNKNRTILSSTSVSLLKDGLAEIQKRSALIR